MYSYKTTGTCSKEINFDLMDGKIHNVNFINGCPGNLHAISQLVEGMDANTVIKKLSGITCGARPTSCGDQFAKALKELITK